MLELAENCKHCLSEIIPIILSALLDNVVLLVIYFMVPDCGRAKEVRVGYMTDGQSLRMGGAHKGECARVLPQPTPMGRGVVEFSFCAVTHCSRSPSRPFRFLLGCRSEVQQVQAGALLVAYTRSRFAPAMACVISGRMGICGCMSAICLAELARMS